MLSSRPRPRQTAARQWLSWHLCVALLRICSVFAMLFAVPGVEEIVVDVAELVTGAECCDDDGCDEGTGHQCPQSCAHGCCVHPTALPPVPHEVAESHFVKPVASFELVAFDLDLAEHRAPPFRPPAS